MKSRKGMQVGEGMTIKLVLHRGHLNEKKRQKIEFLCATRMEPFANAGYNRMGRSVRS
jgi:hypothetical protein